jgi:hypothetical protein
MDIRDTALGHVISQVLLVVLLACILIVAGGAQALGWHWWPHGVIVAGVLAGIVLWFEPWN